MALTPRDNIDCIIDRLAASWAVAQISTARGARHTHDTHSVAVLNLSWQHSGKLLVFFANFCLSQSKLPIEKRPREARFSASILDHRPADINMRVGNTKVKR